MIDITSFEGACGDVDENGFGPIYIQRRATGDDVARGVAGVRERVFEVTQLEVLDASLSQDDVIALVVLVYLFDFSDDHYRGKADRVSIAWADGSRTVTFNYPPPIDN